MDREVHRLHVRHAKMPALRRPAPVRILRSRLKSRPHDENWVKHTLAV